MLSWKAMWHPGADAAEEGLLRGLQVGAAQVDGVSQRGPGHPLPYFAYKALHDTDSLHIKHYIIILFA